MAEQRTAAFYRQRADHMRMMADKAETEALRASYLLAAADWSSLAEQSDNVTPNPQGDGTPDKAASQPGELGAARDSL